MRTALITGTTRGIGKATAELFAENGWDVVAHARMPSQEFEAFCGRIGATPIYFDMTDTAAMKQAVRETVFRPKRKIDVIVNYDGVVESGLFQMTPLKRVREIFEINLFSQMELTQLVLKCMPPKGGSIVNVASVAGITAHRGNTAYGTSKAALIAGTKVLADELMGKVRVNAVAPGLSDTDMAARTSGGKKIVFEKGARLGEPGEIAQAIYFLAGEQASFISGQVLVVDGGIESNGRVSYE